MAALNQTAVGANSQGLTQLAARLRAVGVGAEEAMDHELQAAADDVVAEARARADYSNNVPGSIHAEVVGPGFVRVITRLPEAVAIENKGKGNVRHPLYGNRGHWYTKNSKAAFLLPAFRQMRSTFRERALAAFHDAWAAVGRG